MNDSVVWWLTARYREHECEIVAKDSASSDIEQELKELVRRWGRRFNEAADGIAKDFVKRAVRHSSGNLRSLLKKAGWLEGRIFYIDLLKLI